MGPLLSIKNLTVAAGPKVLVHEASFDVPQGKIVGLAGGSGSGKTTIGLSILRLLPSALSIRGGRIVFGGQDLLGLSDADMRQCRGARMGMIFQEPLSAFDPLFTVGEQIDEVLAAHTRLSGRERKQRVLQALFDAELPDPKQAYVSYPHQLSGGMRQRAMTAQALACGPSLIIADEPTSSLDVTLQAKMMELFGRLKVKKELSMLLIAHDLGTIAHLADEVIICQDGKIVEKGTVGQVIGAPQHEYTKALVEAFQ